MEASGSLSSQGISSLFEKKEIKSFFKTYLFMLFGLEILIFLISFLCQLEPIGISFPWRHYLLASFVTPIVITFLLGVIIKAFNLFCFEMPASKDTPSTSTDKEKCENTPSSKLNASLRFFHQLPFLSILLMLIVGAIIFSQADHIMAAAGVVGEKVLVYLSIALCVLAVIATILLFAWLVIKFKLEKLRYQYEYKRDVMLQLGGIMTEDGKIDRRQGQTISFPDSVQRQIEETKSKDSSAKSDNTMSL